MSEMGSIAMLTGGALANALAFTSSFYSGELRSGSKPSLFAYVKTVNISASSCSE